VSDTTLGIAELAARIPFLLSQLGAYLADDFERRLAPIGVDPRAYAVLLALAERDGQSQRELSTQLGIHRNVMVTVVDMLGAATPGAAATPPAGPARVRGDPHRQGT
jgi:hypothetical protein